VLWTIYTDKLPKARKMSNYYGTRILKEGKYLRVNKGFLEHLRVQDAVHLSFLIELAIYAVGCDRIVYHEKTDTDGWFLCKVSYVCEKLNITESQERRYMENLVELG